MGAMWLKLVEVFQQLAGNAAVRKLIADIAALAIHRIIEWLEGVLRARRSDGGLTAA